MVNMNCLMDYVNSWRINNGITYSGELTSNDLVKFAEGLQNEIANTISFSAPNGESTLVLYSGLSHEDVNIFRKNNNGFYYISNTEANVLCDDDFTQTVNEAISDIHITDYDLYSESTKNFLSGKDALNSRIDQYAIKCNNEILALDDFISKTLTQKAIENGNNIVYVAGNNIKPNSVGVLTEIPGFLSESWIGKTPEEALKSKITIVDDVNKLVNAEVSTLSDITLRNTEFFLDAEGKISGIKLIGNNIPEISLGTTDAGLSIITYGKEVGMLSDAELYSKYSFLNENASSEALETLRIEEYRVKTTGTDNLKKSVLHFDESGKLI
ncbi:MAG: hypothetical protein QM689_03155 [Oscillospiraceae bacterium]